MKAFISILSVAALWQVGDLRAQLAPANELGVSWGHLHLYAQDREKEAKAWLALGGQLGLNLSGGVSASGNVPVTFPGILILINVASASQGGVPTGGSAGSVLDHVAFRVPDLQASLAKWRGPVVAGKDLGWGLKIEPGTKPGQSFVTTPSLIKIEILEDKGLKVPIAFDHAHFFVPESSLPGIEAFYQKTFGAKPVKGEADTYSLPGGKLVFSKSATPTVPTLGRSLEHIGFNFAGAKELGGFSKGLQTQGVKFYRAYRNSSLGNSQVLDGFGTMIELTKGQGGYFDIKQIEPGFYSSLAATGKQGQ